MNTDKMTPVSFEKMLLDLLREYKSRKSFYDVDVSRNTDKDYKNAIGLAAGPHTQLAGNLVAGYGAGATYFELKTVQVLTGEELGIKKPCIYNATEVFNTEWSTELTVEEAKNEYTKAYLLLKVLIQELSLGNPENFTFIMSVGYDLQGIKSPVIDGFINDLKNAEDTPVWKECMAFLKEHLNLFEKVSATYLDSLSPCVSDTIALSTMHGCKREEIEQIAAYLLQEKQLNVYVKMNPTLLGQENVRSSLDRLQYTHLELEPQGFALDITYEEACNMLERLLIVGKASAKTFGVKLTNTLPVKIKRGELPGETMYLSGPALYPIALGVARRLAKQFGDRLPISYSGGVSESNCRDILECGIAPVTVSSFLLKPAGYKNINKLALAAEKCMLPKAAAELKYEELLQEAFSGSRYQYREKQQFIKAQEYSAVCAACHNCVDICPNRANRRVKHNGIDAVIHLDQLCNDCGACSAYCIKGHEPYQEKLTLFITKEAFETTKRPAVYLDKGVQTRNLDEKDEQALTMIKNFYWEEYV